MFALRSKLRRDLLTYFYENRSARVYVRQMAEKVGADPTNVSRELARLEQQGLLVSEREGRQLYYRLDRQSPQMKPLFQLLERAIGVEPTLRRELGKISGLDHAWLYGSYAKGEADARSDIDLLLVGEPDQQQLAQSVSRLERALNREINYTVFGFQELEQRLADEDPFLSDIWNGRRIDLIGSSEDAPAAAKSEAGKALSRRRGAQVSGGAAQSGHR